MAFRVVMYNNKKYTKYTAKKPHTKHIQALQAFFLRITKKKFKFKFTTKTTNTKLKIATHVRYTTSHVDMS